MEKAKDAKHQRKPSFEEPKALSGKQMKSAREAAMEVINNNSSEEATKIFLAGLEPVGNKVKPQGGGSVKKILGK
ncbi:hypothetical protein F0562_002757 [Nyssa sinensis]|uniref:Uncharacterized protein n=1 Tax=Nyssa sinensis TaxID=561372 RepID=A0A5J5BV47_9ASTE|nr:hypothetical protein F0562_002757 [Nyssa sinensis]